ncbi:putative polysaccharide biosynthesis protein [Treponema sp. R6D11]
MASKEKSLFLKGTLIILISNFAVKIISACFKIPLAWLIGKDGIGFFNSAFSIFIFVYTLSSAGVPIAISKMVAECEARGREYEAKRVFKAALIMLTAFGLVFSSMILIFARPLANDFLKNPGVYYPLVYTAPAILFVTISAAFRGYFQGKQNMYPTAISNLLDALGKLVFGCLLSYLLLKYGVQYASGGATLGVSIGAFLGFVLLVSMYFKYSKTNKPTGETKRFKTIAKELLNLSVPITIAACVSTLVNLVDTFTITNRLQAGGLYNATAANALWGEYSGYVKTVYGAPFVVTVSLAIAVVPSIANFMAAGKRKSAEAVGKIALKIALLFTIFCLAICTALALPVLKIFPGSNQTTAELLMIMAPSIVFWGMFAIMQAILQAYGRVKLPIIFIAIGVVANFLINWFAIPTLGIHYASVSSTVCYFLIFILTLIYMLGVTKIRLSINEFLVKPAIYLLTLYFSMFLLYKHCSFGNGFIGLFFAIGVSFLLYILIMFSFGSITEEELKLIPKTEKTIIFLKKHKILR